MTNQLSIKLYLLLINQSTNQPLSIQTPLICAASGGDAECVSILCENDAELNAEDSDGFTAMIKAKSRKNVKIIRELQKAEGTLDVDVLAGSDSEDEEGELN